MGTLEGHVVLVTGGSRGIGAATARAVAAHGANVAIAHYPRETPAVAVVDELRACGVDADAFPVDVADRTAARGMVREVEQRFGRVDALVNNAGIMPGATAFLDVTDADWDLVQQTNLNSAFACSQAVLPGMLARGSGSIVMVTSRLGQLGCAGQAAYSTSKAALLGLVKTLAREYGPRGIRVNAVAPGVTLTDMGRTVAEGEVGRQRLAEIPLGRFGEPHEVAAAIVFLLSSDAALFVGQTLCPNGGGYMP